MLIICICILYILLFHCIYVHALQKWRIIKVYHCVETVKWLDYNRYCQLTRWCSGNASAWGARGPGFNSRIRQGFLCFIFCFVVVVFFLFFYQKTHYLSQKFAIPFTVLIYLVYLTYCKICDRL